MTKCNDCLFHFMNGCVALGGEDYFQQITEKQAKLIIANYQRFDITNIKLKELQKKFPV